MSVAVACRVAPPPLLERGNKTYLRRWTVVKVVKTELIRTTAMEENRLQCRINPSCEHSTGAWELQPRSRVRCGLGQRPRGSTRGWGESCSPELTGCLPKAGHVIRPPLGMVEVERPNQISMTISYQR